MFTRRKRSYHEKEETIKEFRKLLLEFYQLKNKLNVMWSEIISTFAVLVIFVHKEKNKLARNPIIQIQFYFLVITTNLVSKVGNHLTG